MRDLLPYYERELTFLRRHAGEFAARYPKIASRLLISGESCEDPHVERMIESFALLTARVHKKLDDEFPELTHSMLGVLYPHYLRPLPSFSIARFDLAGADAQMSGPSVVPRHTALSTRPVKGVVCKFRTAYPVALAPVRVAAARFAESFTPPRGFMPPAGAAGLLSLDIELSSPQLAFDTLRLDCLRLFVDGETSLVSHLRETMLSRTAGVCVEVPGAHRWAPLPLDVAQAAGFGTDEELLDYDARSHLAYRLLTEFFAYPEKFNFIDLNLAEVRKHLPAGCRQFSLHFVLDGRNVEARGARIMERVSTANFLTHCTPVINLFQQSAEPIRLSHLRSSYTLLPDARRAHAFEVYAVDAVRKIEKTAQGEQLREYSPYYSLKHGQSLQRAGRFYQVRRDEQVAERSPGHEYEISVVDLDFDPRAEKTETLSIELTCTNRDLPAQMPFGMAGGDLFMEGGSLARSISLLRKPTPSVRVEGEGAHWKLISHLSLNHLSLTETGLDALKETFALYDIHRSATNRRLLDGLAAISHRVATARVTSNPFPCFVKGIEIELAVDPVHFVGIGVEQFARVLDHFFGLYVHVNSFTRLRVISHESGEEILKCPARNGDQILA